MQGHGIMKELYMIRHGIADKREEDIDDEARELTKKGKDKMKAIAQGLKDAGIRFDAIVSSPLVRTAQTAEIIQKCCSDGKDIIMTDLLKPGATFDPLVEYLNTVEGDSVAIVGHEPFLSGFASYCLSQKKNSFINIKKGGIALLETDGPIKPGHCKIDWLLEPNQIIKL